MQIIDRCLLPSNVYVGLYEEVQSQVFSTVKWTLGHALDEEVHDDLGKQEWGLYKALTSG